MDQHNALVRVSAEKSLEGVKDYKYVSLHTSLPPTWHNKQQAACSPFPSLPFLSHPLSLWDHTGRCWLTLPPWRLRLGRCQRMMSSLCFWRMWRASGSRTFTSVLCNMYVSHQTTAPMMPEVESNHLFDSLSPHTHAYSCVHITPEHSSRGFILQAHSFLAPRCAHWPVRVGTCLWAIMDVLLPSPSLTPLLFLVMFVGVTSRPRKASCARW